MIKAIYVTGAHSGTQESVDEVDVVLGCGIVGDRNFDEADWPGQNVTFVESEEIERFNQTYEQNIDLSATRRNIVTQGIRLNDLVGKEFRVGETRFIGVELCEPCAGLGATLENDKLSKAQVVKAFTHKAGLRANALSNGKLSVGMTFRYRRTP